MKNKINYWQIVYILILIGITKSVFITLNDQNLATTSKILLSIIGGLLGLFIERIINNKKWIFKLFLLIILIAIPLILKTYYLNQNYKSCEICGYFAVDEEGFCNSCFCDEWETVKTTGDFQDYDIWVKEMQLETFALDSLNQENIFELIDSDKEFKKDTNWKPLISLIDLKENFK